MIGQKETTIEDQILLFAIIIVVLALFFDYSNGFHDAANVVATIIITGALSLSHGANDAQKSMGLITMSLIILGILPTFHIPFWVIASCATAIALGTTSGGWRIIRTMGSKIYRLRSVHAFCAQTSSAAVILGAALVGGPVSTTHVVSSSIMGVGAGQRVSAVRWGVAKNIILAWFITIPASAVMAGLSFFLIRVIHPKF